MTLLKSLIALDISLLRIFFLLLFVALCKASISLWLTWLVIGKISSSFFSLSLIALCEWRDYNALPFVDNCA